MKSTFFAAGFLASVALAQPHHGHAHGRRAHNHGHAHAVEERADTACAVEWTTETVVEWIDATTTVYSTEKPAASASSEPAQFHESKASSAPVVVAPTTPPAAPAPAPTTTSVASAPPAATTAPVVQSPAPQVTQQAVATQQASPAAQQDSGSSGAVAAADGPFSGDLTFYTIGMGACGEDDSGKDDSLPIVALSHLYMGTASNSNPLCGKTITITYGGKSTQAVIKDKCMGCGLHDIDVSNIVFKDLVGDFGVGRTKCSWSLNA